MENTWERFVKQFRDEQEKVRTCLDGASNRLLGFYIIKVGGDFTEKEMDELKIKFSEYLARDVLDSLPEYYEKRRHTW